MVIEPDLPWPAIETTLRAAAPERPVPADPDYRVRGPFLPANTQIAGIPTRGA